MTYGEAIMSAKDKTKLVNGTFKIGVPTATAFKL